MARSRTVLVAGAGIGGLAAALSLARASLRPVLLERAARLAEIGAGIQLTPNATCALQRLGVLDRVQERAVKAQEILVSCGETGNALARAPLGNAVSRFGAPWLLTLRADLQAALLAAAMDNVDVALEEGAEVIDFASHTRGVTALVRRGDKSEEHLGIALIGADGLWSKVRARLHGAAPPSFPQQVAWRALVSVKDLPSSFAEPVVRLWLHADAHLVHYPVVRGEFINVVAVFRDDWKGEGWDEPAARNMPLAVDRWAEMPRQVLRAAKDFRRWTLADRDPLPHWGEDRVTLLGDAAHPMLPFLAQGAAAALEDAVVLGRQLQQRDDPASALRAYERERAPRTESLQRTARFSGRIYHARGFLRWARDFKLRWDAERLIDRHAWIYRYMAA